MAKDTIFLIEKSNKEGLPWHAELQPGDWPYLTNRYFRRRDEADLEALQYSNKLDPSYHWKATAFVRLEE